MRVLSTTACTGRSIDEFLGIYQELKEPLRLSGIELAVGIPFTTDDIEKIKQAGIGLVLWHDAFWFVDGKKKETYPTCIADYFALHGGFSALDIDVPLWSIHPYKSHAPQHQWNDTKHEEFVRENWYNMEYALTEDEDYGCYEPPRQFKLVFENMLPNAPCYNNLDSIFSSTVQFCIDYSHINLWTKNNREQTIIQSLLATRKAREIHLSSNHGIRDSHDYIPPTEWFLPYLDSIEKAHPSLYITYESLPAQYKQYGRLDKR